MITAPESVRARFRAQRSTRTQISIAAALRPGASTGDVEEITVLSVLRQLARRVQALEAEAAEHEP